MIKKNKKCNLENDELEKILDVTWKNWESRRKCEQSHIPEYIKKKKNENHIK